MNKKYIILFLILSITAYLRFYNLLHDAPYFFNPDERNMANSISQLRLPAKWKKIPDCILSEIDFKRAFVEEKKPISENCNLNPHFFAYGQFPLYLAFFSDQTVKLAINLLPFFPNLNNISTKYLSTSFPSAIFWLRFWSAFSSTITVLIVFLISNLLFGYFFALIGAILTAFTPGVIQAAHFGTTESLLTLFFLASVYFSLRLLQKKPVSSLASYLRLNYPLLLLVSLSIGLAMSSKLTGFFFFAPPLLMLATQFFILLNFKKKKRKRIICLIGILTTIGFLILTSALFFTLVTSFYNLIEFANFKSAVFGYESDVATGRYEAFYTRQFANTTPILFQLEKIFPYVLGWPIFILGFFGFFSMIINLISKLFLFTLYSIKYQVSSVKQIKKGLSLHTAYYILLTASFLVYFLPNAFLFAKWTRFMTPIFPFFAIFSAYSFFLICSATTKAYLKFPIPDSRFPINPNWLIGSLTIISLIPGLMLMSIYFREDSRLTASKWIYQNIPNDSYILSETANVVDIPLGLAQENEQKKNYTVISFDFYHLDEDPTLFDQLLIHLEKADYLFIPSRRIFSNHSRQPEKYPLVAKYYQLLFSKELGFEKVVEITSFPSLQLGNWKLEINDESSEETYTVFDHPVIRIYKKVLPMSKEQYRLLFDKYQHSLRQ